MLNVAQSNFFVKTHYHDGQSPDIHYWDRWDKIVTVVRNPLDAVASYLQFSIASRNRGGENEHESKPVETYGAANRLEIEKLARRWASHARTIHNAPKLKHLARYEDIREAPVTHIMSMLAFVLPANELPPLARVACIARHDEHLEPYKSRKSRPFSSWDQWEPELRQYVLKVTQPYVRMKRDCVTCGAELSCAVAGSAIGVTTRSSFKNAVRTPCRTASATASMSPGLQSRLVPFVLSAASPDASINGL